MIGGILAPQRVRQCREAAFVADRKESGTMDDTKNTE